MKSRVLNYCFLACAILVALAGVACDRVPLLAPTQSTIALSSATRVLALGASTQLTAVVVEQAGTPVQNGTTVLFSATLGRVEPAQSQTKNGVATVTFFAGETSGIAEVRATSGGAGAGEAAGATNTVEILVGAAALDNIVLRANPSSVGPSGGTVDLIASAAGENGRALSGLTLGFNTTNGTLSSTSAITDANGEARTQLTTSVQATVSARLGAKTSNDVVVTVRAAPLVTLTCSGTGAAGTTCAQAAGQTVSFNAAKGATSSPLVSSTLDFGDGSPTVSLGALTSASTVTKTYSSAGAYTARLTATDASGETTTATVSVTITVTPVNVTITATAGTGNPTGKASWSFTAGVVPTSTVVENYSWDFGDGTGTVTTSGATTNHVYEGPAGSTARTVTVTVRTADGRTFTARTQIIVTIT